MQAIFFFRRQGENRLQAGSYTSAIPRSSLKLTSLIAVGGRGLVVFGTSQTSRYGFWCREVSFSLAGFLLGLLALTWTIPFTPFRNLDAVWIDARLSWELVRSPPQLCGDSSGRRGEALAPEVFTPFG